MKRIALVVAGLALPVACASVLGVSGTFTDAVENLCGCDDVPQLVEGDSGRSCVDILTGRLGDASDAVQQDWIEAVNGGCGSCASAPTCLNKVPLCAQKNCGPDLPCCSADDGGPVVCNAGTCAR